MNVSRRLGILVFTAVPAIIGGGIIGVATSFWLSRAGLKTILVEMRDGLSTLTTTASIESFRAQFTEPAMAALAQRILSSTDDFGNVLLTRSMASSIRMPVGSPWASRIIFPPLGSIAIF